MKNICYTILPVLLMIDISAFAVSYPRSLKTDSRIKVVNYQENNVVPIYGSTLITTQIVFGRSERIVDVEGGDAAAWTINTDKGLANTINIKPTMLNSSSNMTVVTIDTEGKRKNYYFNLRSNKKIGEKGTKTYAVHFKYPIEEKKKLLKKLNFESQQKKAILNSSRHPNEYNWDYSFSGNKSIMPLHVFDDGKFTYLELRSNQDIPAVFSVNNSKGEESVVNYRREGNFLIVLQVSPQFTLRNGHSVVSSIFNNKAIQKIARSY